MRLLRRIVSIPDFSGRQRANFAYCRTIFLRHIGRESYSRLDSFGNDPTDRSLRNGAFTSSEAFLEAGKLYAQLRGTG